MCPAQAFAQPTTTDSPISDLIHAGSIPKEPGALSELRKLYLADNKLTVALILGERVTMFFSPASGTCVLPMPTRDLSVNQPEMSLATKDALKSVILTSELVGV